MTDAVADAILDHRLVRERYFFPRDDDPETPWDVAVADGTTLRCARAGDGPDWLVFFHGNGEVVADWEETLPAIVAPTGWSTLLVEYRGYGGSTGSPALAAMLPDGADVLGKLGARRVVAMGRSIGSLYATELATRIPVAGVILESGISDLTERVLVRVAPRDLGTDDAGLRAAVAHRFDQAAKIRALGDRPLLVLHAEDDDLVGVGHARRNVEAAGNGTLLTFARGGHNAILAVNFRAYAEAVRQFLRALG